MATEAKGFVSASRSREATVSREIGMSMTSFQSIRKAVGGLNPRSIRDLSDRPLNIAIYASGPEDYKPLEEFFLQGISEDRRREVAKSLHRGPDPKGVLNFDIAVYDDSVLAPRRAMV